MIFLVHKSFRSVAILTSRAYHTGTMFLPPSAEASNGPNAHPQNNRKVTKFPSAGPMPTHGTIPLPSEGLLTWTYPLTCTLSITKRTSA